MDRLAVIISLIVFIGLFIGLYLLLKTTGIDFAIGFVVAIIIFQLGHWVRYGKLFT